MCLWCHREKMPVPPCPFQRWRHPSVPRCRRPHCHLHSLRPTTTPQAWRQMSLFTVNLYFGVTPPAAQAESGENNHCCGDDQNVSPCVRLRRSRRNCRRWRHGDGLFTARTIDLRSRIAGVALNVLAAERAGEFEFSHKFDWPQNVPASESLMPILNFHFRKVASATIQPPSFQIRRIQRLQILR